MYKVVTRLCFGVIQQHKVSAGKWRLSVGDKHLYYSHPTAILLLFVPMGRMACSVTGALGVEQNSLHCWLTPQAFVTA